MIVRPYANKSRATILWGVFFIAAIVGVCQIFLPRWANITGDANYTIRRDRLQQRLSATQAAHAGERPKLVVALGTSRVYHGLDGEVLEQELRAKLGPNVCFANFAAPATTPFHSMVLLGRLLRDGIQPDVIVIEAFPHCFEASRPQENYFVPNYISMCAGDEDWLNEHHIPVRIAQEDRRGVAIYDYRTEVLRLCAPHLLPKSEIKSLQTFANTSDTWGSGMIPLDRDPKRLQDALAHAKSEYFATYQNADWRDKHFDILRQLLEECHARNIATIVMTTPEGPIMRSWYREGGYDNFVERLAAVTRGCDSQLVIGTQWLEEEDFVDSHHMFAPGAAKFSARLSREAIGPALQQQAIARKSSNAVRR